MVQFVFKRLMQVCLLGGMALLLYFMLGLFKQSDSILGVGASFPAPLYFAWAAKYKTATDNRVNYQIMGSKAGRAQVSNKTVDFGASDVPMSSESLRKEGLIQFPTVIGSIVVVVNLGEIAANSLQLTGEIIAKIYLGDIRNWSDTAITAINPHLRLPDLPIVPVYRSEGSGTTFVFAEYLQSIVAEWGSTVGVATSVKWPVGIGSKGNDGVAATTKNIVGSIGYVEYAYALASGLAMPKLRNSEGNFVTPTIRNFRASVLNADWSNCPVIPSLVNVDGESSWPIMSATYILLHKSPANLLRTYEVLDFFDWSFSHGDEIAKREHYLTLSDTVKECIRDFLESEFE